MKPSSAPMAASEKPSVTFAKLSGREDDDELEEREDEKEEGREGRPVDGDLEEVEKKTVSPPDDKGGKDKNDSFSLIDVPTLGHKDRNVEAYLTHLRAIGLDIDPDGKGWRIKKGREWVEIPKMSKWMKEGEKHEKGMPGMQWNKQNLSGKKPGQ